MQFLKDAGIFVTPALRRGNELGEAWHEAAMKENKSKKTFDSIDSANWRIANNWTQWKKASQPTLQMAN